MSQDKEMTIDYRVVLNDLERKLDSMDSQRRALESTIAGVKSYLAAMDGEALELPLGSTNGNGHKPKLPIPPSFFSGKTPTAAYRDLIRLWPGEYTPPQVADAFQLGGMEMSRTRLLQAVHSVVKREKEKGKKSEKDG